MRKIAWGRVCLLILAGLVILAGIFAGGYLLGQMLGNRAEGGAESVPESSAAVPESSSPAEEPSEPAPSGTLTGTVTDGTMSTLSVEAEDGAAYTFDKTDAVVDGGETGILIGGTVTVYYTGTLDPESEVQPVTVEKITVDAPPPDKEEEARRRAEEILSGMTLEEKVGQMFIARCPEEGAAEKVSQYHPGGYILFARDFENRTPETAAAAIQSYQEASDIPLLIGVDEEGGTVNRVSLYPAYRSSPFPSPQALYQSGGFEAVAADTAEKCALLSSLGINVNFAPVCDVSENPEDFIYARSFGADAESTAQYVKTVVEAMDGTGVLSVLKHFPGYGNNADTHTGIAYDNRPYKTFLESDFLPFEAGIEAGAEMVLISHNVINCIDPDLPASLSPAVHQVLRETLGFDGVIVTDDLVMGAIRDFAGDEEAAVLAVEAGNDLLCCTDFETQIPAVIAAVESGEIAEERIDESVIRILMLKIEAGIL